ncbi:FAD-binding and (Fe-S)-binding domain-containing protein [Rhodococcus aerolatus]
MPDDLTRALAAGVRGRVRADTQTLATHAADASNHRHVPLAVVEPVDADDVAAALAVCREHGAPVLPRGAATSIAGQSVNTAVVLDVRRHLGGVHSIDPEARSAVIGPGVVLDDLQRAAAPHGLRFGPDPSTHSRCTVGGMIGNNACGSHSVAWGKTVDSVRSLDVITYRGERLTAGPGAALGGHRVLDELARVRDRWAGDIRTGFPHLTRRVSGYNLDELRPDPGTDGRDGTGGTDLARLLVGTEGTCATIVQATVGLVAVPATTALAVLGYPTSYAAAEAASALVAARDAGELALQTVEGVDASLVETLRAGRPDATSWRALPEGRAWLFVEVPGATAAEAAATAEAVRRRSQSSATLVVTDRAQARDLWSIREQGAGLATRAPDGSEAWPGWEDSAVPVERLADYLRGFDALLAEHHLRTAYYGHFGDGCVHARIDVDLLTRPGIAAYRRFLTEAADLVTGLGGSLSGEHGDGQARAELLTRMYPAPVVEAMGAFKAAWDPDGAMNPHRVVDPAPLDADLRIFLAGPTLPLRTTQGMALPADGGSVEQAVRRCVGVGACLNGTASGGVMCPSYRATGEEQHSTRGRARLLHEMLRGDVVTDGWRSTEVRDALDLCLGCKGCKSDCPVDVDVASYKAEFLHQHFAGRLRPRDHYALGWLPVWLRLVRGPRRRRLLNRAARVPALARLAALVGGLTPEQAVPPLAEQTFREWFTTRPAPDLPDDAPRLLLWPDTFTDHLDPAVGRAAVAVLERLGHRVEIPDAPVCCGLTWTTTGQLDRAKQVLARSVAAIAPWLEQGVPVVGLEPSCTAALRHDVAQLLPDEHRLAPAVRTFAEVLATHDLAGLTDGVARDAVVQVHCHQHAELGTAADREVMAALGIRAEVLDSGCCGLAGSFGFTAGHHEVSQAVGEAVLLPAVRAAAPTTTVLADGFSCRTQVRHGTERAPEHLAELAARVLGVSSRS